MNVSRRGAFQIGGKLAAGAAASQVTKAVPGNTASAVVGASSVPMVPLSAADMLAKFAGLARNEDLLYDLLQLSEYVKEVLPIMKRYMSGDATCPFDKAAYSQFENLRAALTAIAEENFEFDHFRASTSLIERAFRNANSSISVEEAELIQAVPDFFNDVLGQPASVHEAIELFDQRKVEVLIRAVNQASNLLDPNARHEIFLTASHGLPDDHPLKPQLEKVVHARLMEELDERHRQSVRDIEEIRADQLNKRLARYADGERTSHDTMLLPGTPENNFKVYVVADPKRIISAADVNMTIQQLGFLKGYQRPPIGDLKIGRDYILRQDGDNMVKVTIKHNGLNQYLESCDGKISLTARERPPFRPLEKLLQTQPDVPHAA
jgi:hypothetical protein